MDQIPNQSRIYNQSNCNLKMELYSSINDYMIWQSRTMGTIEEKDGVLVYYHKDGGDNLKKIRSDIK